MVAMSEAEDEAVTDRGTKGAVEGSRGCKVAKSTTGMGEWTGNSCEKGMGESLIAPAGYCMQGRRFHLMTYRRGCVGIEVESE
jgi:hypothetical protein